MSLEELSKNTASVIGSIMNQPQWRKNEVQNGIQQILLQKRQRASSEAEYLESLLQNVTFLIENTNGARSFLSQCIEGEQFFPPASLESFMLAVRNQINDPNYLAQAMPHYKEFVYKGSTTEEQVANAEMVYSNCKLVNDMMLDFLMIFLHPENRSYMVNYLEYNSEVVVSTVFNYCQTYSRLLLDDAASM